MEVWKVGKTFLIHRSSSMLWEMIVSNVMCMKIEYIRLKHAKWVVWSFNRVSLSLASLSMKTKSEFYFQEAVY
ncbi:hypothetical protein LDENG_00166260 [Lucifuga dentata]|nr:hypothetical protein LDENG_00166260 [Lucifuga dentata]